MIRLLSLRKATKARKAAFLAHREAVARGDTRTIHSTRIALSAATTRKLALEVGR